MSLVSWKVLVLGVIISGHSIGDADAASKSMVRLDADEDYLTHVSRGSKLVPVFTYRDINLEAISCQTDEQCIGHLPNLEVALSKNSNVSSAPYCLNPSNVSTLGHCTCGEGKCVSYTKEFGRGTILYYCGPCSYVGARCSSEFPCQHELAECRNNFCGCKNGGDFFELSYCEVPYLGFEVALQMVYVVCIILTICIILASSYGIIYKTRLRRLVNRPSQQEECESPPADLPPKYDDLVDMPPSYDEAIFTVQQEYRKRSSGELGHDNIAFDTEETEPRNAAVSKTQKRNNQTNQREDLVPAHSHQARDYVENYESNIDQLDCRPPGLPSSETPIRDMLYQ
ncbi:uncharacterized protein LOC122249620 [Penaeus japonicus]|uniref:uncharacterized protein LOC122249620 n=1 Tax=Penaeus japonicus TaxID=27405 RepID=UPI001C71080A|nr:uncharacterized protein LOC122249620 [Penaeus japonicus]